MSEAYLVPNLAPDEIHREEDVVRRSRFIVSIARVSSTEEAKAFIERIRAEHPTATHNCWAYNAGRQKILRKWARVTTENLKVQPVALC